MSRSKIDFNSKSKLSALLEPDAVHDELNLNYSLAKSQKTKVKSFRLREIDIQTLNSTINRLNNSGKIQPINTSDLLKGLLFMASQMTEEKIINFIKMSY